MLRTDHASLQWLFWQNNDRMIFRMLQKLQEFDFQVVHRPGEKQGNADRLSRQTESFSEALGHIQMVTSPELNPCSSETKPLSKI